MATEHQIPEGSDQIRPIQLLMIGNQAQIPAPLIRITTCGLLNLELVEEIVSTDPPLARYASLTPEQLRGRGTGPALMLLKLFLSRPERFAAREWLLEQFCRDGELFSSVRIDNIVSLLRSLICPPASPASKELRTQVVAHVRSSNGDGYQLAAFPLIWVDHEALSWNIEQAVRMERFGDDGSPFWERAYEIARRGSYLPDEVYSDWASFRRGEIAGMLRQSVQALARLYQIQHGAEGEEEALLLLRNYWQEHPREEDTLRPLMELLGKRECAHEALGYYEQLCRLLEEDERRPDAQTQDVAEYIRTKQLQRPTHLQIVLQREQQESPPPFQPEIHSVLSPLLYQGKAESALFSPFSLSLAQGIMQSISQQPSAQDISLIGLTSEQADFLSSFLREISMTHFDFKKRKTLQQIAAAISLSMTLPRNFIRPELWNDVFSIPKSIDEESFDRYEKLLTLCWNLLKGSEWATVAYLLPTFFSEIEEEVQQSSHHQKIVAGFAAQAYIIKSLVVGHQNNLAAKLLACNTAIEYSHFANNHDLEVTALIQQAVTFDSQKQHENSLSIYQQALSHLDSVSPLLGTRILAGLGGSYARCGQQEYEAQRHLDWARKLLPDRPEEDPSFLYADCGPFTLPLWEGRTYFELDQLERAFQVFAQEKDHRGIPERIRTEFLNHLLETSIAQGDLDQSIMCLQEANQAAINLKSERRQREVHEAYQTMLHIWRHDRKRIQDAIEVSAK